MSSIHVFIGKYLDKFLNKCQIRSPFSEEEQTTHIPPTSLEVEMLIPYLQKHELDPVITGALAVVKHLKITDEDIRNRTFRPTNALEIFVSKVPMNVPEGWRIQKESSGRLAWISPGGGYVLFFVSADNFSIGKDPESIAMNCPVADILTIFKMKLNSSNEIDLYHLMCLASRTGMPKNLDNLVENKVGSKNLEFLKRWINLRKQTGNTHYE